MPKTELPIESIRFQLAETIGKDRRFVLEAPTGSGKSTQVPQMLVDEGLIGNQGVVWMLQPRRIAARMLAKRIAWERWDIRFDLIGSLLNLRGSCW